MGEVAAFNPDVIVAADVFHSSGTTTAAPFLESVAQLCAGRDDRFAVVVSSFRSEDTTRTVDSVCGRLRLRRTVQSDSLLDGATPASRRCLVEHLYVCCALAVVRRAHRPLCCCVRSRADRAVPTHGGADEVGV